MVEQEVIDCVNDLVNKVVKQDSNRRYREKNKEKKNQHNKEYREKNKDKTKEYYEKNKKKILQQMKEYHQTPQGKKSQIISGWKRQGIICDNWDALYDHYLKTSFCDLCKVKLTNGNPTTATTKCCDHDHSITDRPNFRNILCHSCNVCMK